MDKAIFPAPVRKRIEVAAPAVRAFETFTAGMSDWWFKGHSLTSTGQAAVVIEPRVGGRWYERGTGGEECDWGRVLAWEPPHRVLLVWSLTSEWLYDPALHTELEVRFTALTPDTTRVELEHRNLERYGDAAARTGAILDSDKGWGGLIAAYQRRVEG